MMMADDMAGFLTGLLMAVAMIGVLGMFEHCEHFAAMRGHSIFGMCGCRHDQAAEQNSKQHQ
jgi:hypothetical protein